LPEFFSRITGCFHEKNYGITIPGQRFAGLATFYRIIFYMALASDNFLQKSAEF